MGITLVLFGLSMLTISGVQQRTSLNAEVDMICADLYQQRLKAITGDTESRDTHDLYGIYLRSDDYVLFHGARYSEDNSDNYTVSLGNGVQYTSVTFPDNQIVFASGSGEIVNFQDGRNSFIVTHATLNEQRTVILNRYGVVTAIQK